MARDNNMSQLDYLWTYFGNYKVSEQVSDNPSDENILTEKALLDFINASILSRKVVSTLLYRKSSKPDTMEIVGVGTDGAEVTTIEVPAEVHVEKFETRLITQEDIEKGSEIPLDSKVLSLVLTNGTEFLVSLEQLNLEVQGYESDTIKTDVVNHVVKSDLKINKGNNTLSVVKIRTNNDGVWGDLEVSPRTTGVVFTKQINGLEASIPIQNTENNIQFMQLTLEHYLGLVTKDPGMVYFITDKPYIYLSGMRYGLDVQQGTYLITGLSFNQEKAALIVNYLGKEDAEVPIGEATENSKGLMTSQMVQSLKECVNYKEIADNYTVNGHKISENPVLDKEDIGLSEVNNTSDLNKPVSTATQTALEELDSRLSESVTTHIADKSNPHQVTKEQVGLANVNNTSDLNKPISTATQGALDTLKSDLTHNLELHSSNHDNPHQVTKAQIGLGNVNNTSDLNKPISNIQQGALDLKVDKEIGKSLVEDTEITKLKELSNQDIINTAIADAKQSGTNAEEHLAIVSGHSEGIYTPNETSNYITEATSLNSADIRLDAQIKLNADAIEALRREIINKIEDAPYDGRKYARMNGKWVKLEDNLAIINIDQTISDPETMISGDVNNNVIQWIRKNSHRVLAKKTGEGTVTYIELDDTNSNKYAADGTEAKTDGTEGDVFVKLPTFYYRGNDDGPDGSSGDNVKITFSTEPFEDCIEWDTNILIGAYKAYYGDGKLQSRSGVISSGNISQENFKSYAAARGSGYQLVDWQMHCVLGCLFYAMYGNTNSQAICGSGTASATKTCGETNSLGMNDTKAETNAINFWGLENWWGNKYEFIEGIESTGIDTVQILSPDPSSGRTFTWRHNSSYGKHYRFGKYLDLSSDVTSSGSNSTYYCDYNYGPASSACVVYRGCNNASAVGGVSNAHAFHGASGSSTYVGSRLAFRGICTKAESVEAFKSLPI